MQQVSKGKAILEGKCPRCRKGDMFPHSLFSTKFSQMNADCPNCGFHFEMEPGFFVGAMYINYAFSVAIFVAVGIALMVFNALDAITYLITVCLVVLILLPPLFRYSRILFLHIFGGVKYQAER